MSRYILSYRLRLCLSAYLCVCFSAFLSTSILFFRHLLMIGCEDDSFEGINLNSFVEFGNDERKEREMTSIDDGH